MPLPIVADCYQALLIWNNANAPRPATNVLHFYNSATPNTSNELFADLEASVTSAMWSYGSTASRVASVIITPLDGVTAASTYTTVNAAKWKGGNTGDILLTGSLVVSLKSAQRGPRGRNRVYLPWVAEAVSTNGTIDSGNISAMQPAWDTFNATMGTAGWQLYAVSGKYDDGHDVTSIAVRSAMKTQRRRQLR